MIAGETPTRDLRGYVEYGYRLGWSFTPLNGKAPVLKGWQKRPRESREQVPGNHASPPTPRSARCAPRASFDIGRGGAPGRPKSASPVGSVLDVPRWVMHLVPGGGPAE